MLGSLWLIPILALAGFALNLLAGVLKARKPVVTLIGVGSIGAATVAAYTALWQYLHQPNVTLVERYFTWISAGRIDVTASFQLDPLSAVMLAFVTFVGFLIHVYSIGYMHGEPDTAYARYFAYLNLFMFSMLTLILGSNLVVLFVGWEGVGLCSYLLIGFYFDQVWPASAGKKAFIVNRIGDFGFILAIFTTFAVFGTAEFTRFLPQAAADPHAYAGAATIIGLLLFVGATGKSAQIPLYIWLPDAMAGPTPVSALIHAATMVTAGVYMVVRTNVIYRLSPTALIVVAIIGGLTAFYAATIGLVQNDIKKVLAYSTVSQLGYMFLGAGVGAFVAGIFHVVTHAFFKALLFLGSGSVIHACSGNQDMRTMGGLKKYMPITYWTFLAATLAIAGIVPFAGFFSKDEILAKAFEAGASNLNGYGSVYYVLWFLGLAGAVLTAFYMFRLVYMTFHGEFRGTEEEKHHLHESPWTMTLPLVVLGILSTIGGFLGVPKLFTGHESWNLIERFVEPILIPLGGAAHEAAEAHHAVSAGVEWGLVFLSLAVAVTGILVARSFYLTDPEFNKAKALAERFPFAYKLLLNKYWVDEIYEAVVVLPIYKAAMFCWKVVDVILIDGIMVNGTAFMTELTGDILRFLQTGNVRNYALSVAMGVLLLIVILW
ncbi:MAG TPA: NADH-quinone oxidoreductase subunit L [Acidobacteria bacterium]|nr:NADH-quinone oxidoreductase subunit L [Acidobacteriota bacterium]